MHGQIGLIEEEHLDFILRDVLEGASEQVERVLVGAGAVLRQVFAELEEEV